MQKILYLLFLSLSVYGQQPQFNARGLFCLADGDSDISNFLNSEKKSEHVTEDKLHIVRFPATSPSPSEKYHTEIPISNSMFSTSTIVEVSTSQPALAYILETKGNATKDGLQSGGFISVMDVSSLNLPKALFRFPVATNPLSIALSPNNEYLAVSSEELDNEIQLIEVNSEGKPVRKIKKPSTLGNDKITHLCWSPDGEFLVYTNETRREIGLITVMRDPPTQKIIRLKQVGQPINLGLQPGFGQFTPDGKYYIASDLKQDRSTTKEVSPAEIFVIRFSFESGGQHFLLSKEAVGLNLESFVIHPNSSTIFALSSEQSFYPDVKLTDKTSGKLHLLNLTDSGVISEVATYPIKGKYPSGLAMDTKGENLAVSVSEYNTYGLKLGGLQFWKYTAAPTKKLQQQAIDFYFPKGVHYLKTID